ncbi:large subunit ribosomal protein L12e [Angomonas deanei]|nr:large subunit ribosomal protein L12e [Angomonas deanei]|eukprot:EPY42691.1 large subunit ribosomal protein L12e [Angomonas deanei]
MAWGDSPSTWQPTETAVPSTSITTDLRLAPMDLGWHSLAILMISEKVMLPSCLMFFTFLRSRAGSLRARMIREAAEGVTTTVATRFLTRSSQVTLRPFQSLVDLAMSSPIFLAFKPRGPTLGAREAVAATSPPTARTMTTSSSLGSNLGGMRLAEDSLKGYNKKK